MTKYATLVARFLVGGLFIYAALTKIPDPEGFAESIRNYTILPVQLTNLAAMILPWIEVIAGAALILGLWTKAGALVTSAMLLAFALAVTYAYSIGLDISCGCFGPEESGTVDLLTVIREWSLFLVSLLILIFDKGQLGLDRLFDAGGPSKRALGRA